MAIMQDLANWAPTIGSVLGGLGAGAVDIGTGGAGVVLDPLIMGAASGAGDMVGKALQNTYDKKPITNNLLTSGLEAGAGGIAGGALGEGIGAIAGKVGGELGNAGTNAMANEFADNSGKLAGGLTNSDVQGLGGLGFKNAGEVAQAAPDLTGGAEYPGSHALTTLSENKLQSNRFTTDLSNIVGAPLKSGELPASNTIADQLPNLAQNLNDTYSTSLSDAGKTDILNTVDRSNQNLLSGSQALNPGVLNNSIGTTPSDVAWNEAKNLESQASDIRQAATDEKGMWKSTAQDQEAKYKVLLDRANSIKQSVLDQSNGALNITPQDAASFESVISQSPNLSDPVKANLINKVNGIANAGGSIKEIDSLQSPFVRASKAAQELSAVAAKTAPTTLLGKAANVVGSPIDSGRAALSGIANSGVANSIEQSPLVSGMGNILQSAGTTGGQQASSLLGDLVGSGALSLGSDQLQSNPNIPNNTTSPVNGIQPSVDPLAGNIFASLDPALGQGAYEQPMALQALTGMYDPALMSQFTPAATAAATRLGQVQTAANALQGLEGKFQAAGGGQGPLMGTLSQIGGKVSGNEAGQYAGQAQNVGTELQAAGVPQAEINNFLPQLTENNSAANAGIQQLINYLMTLGAPAFNNNTAVR